MQLKKIALIGTTTLALMTCGITFAGSDVEAMAKDKQEKADAAVKFSDEKQAEAEAAVKAGAPDAGAQVDEAAAAAGVAADKMNEAAAAQAADAVSK